jgi:hypothetical protein
MTNNAVPAWLGWKLNRTGFNDHSLGTIFAGEFHHKWIKRKSTFWNIQKIVEKPNTISKMALDAAIEADESFDGLTPYHVWTARDTIAQTIAFQYQVNYWSVARAFQKIARRQGMELSEFLPCQCEELIF